MIATRVMRGLAVSLAAALPAAGAWAQENDPLPDTGAEESYEQGVGTVEAAAEAPPARRTERGGAMRQVSPHMGEMLVEMDMPAEVGEGLPEDAVRETLRFEPWQMLDEMFLRDDVVFVMRHGPTDWSKLDDKDVAPTDCEGQRMLSPEGRDRMVQMGQLMAANDVVPSAIVVSQWCRNQDTLAALLEGFDAVDPALRETIPVETDPGLNLLLALQGAPDVEVLRERIAGWDGSPDGRPGPLLLISHFTNIEELTTFTVYEGEMLIVDPDREGRVLGYLRLTSAGPDIGHFDVEE